MIQWQEFPHATKKLIPEKKINYLSTTVQEAPLFRARGEQ